MPGLLAATTLAATGCAALLLVGGAGTGAIAFATGELRTTQATSMAELDVACGRALDTLGYDAIEVTRQEGQVRWHARTAGGDPVDVRLRARKDELTEIRIRVGTFGDEARSRLVLEEIQQSL